MTYFSPGIKIEEAASVPSTSPSSSPTIPLFLGMTEIQPAPETAMEAETEVVVRKVGSAHEFQGLFGTPTRWIASAMISVSGEHSLYNELYGELPTSYSLAFGVEWYFRSGGGPCYVMSTGAHRNSMLGSGLLAARLIAGIRQLNDFDEPSLVAAPDLIHLKTPEHNAVCREILAHCSTHGNRFALLDLLEKHIDGFRQSLGGDNLSFGAAYYPPVKTTLPPIMEQDIDTVIVEKSVDPPDWQFLSPRELKDSHSADYAKIMQFYGQLTVTCAPSLAIAAAFVRNDRERGVWKAPGNLSLPHAIRTLPGMSDEQQHELNHSGPEGPWINALRTVSGRGVVISDIRTLDGRDAQWRYISTRRLFLHVEALAKQATSFAVFEPNDVTTWRKIHSVLDALLLGLWERGAMQGSTPEAAYRIHVGLGTTMTNQDVAEGRVVVELGLAVVRPAEFVILRFSQDTRERA